jgi:hypothetical protein
MSFAFGRLRAALFVAMLVALVSVAACSTEDATETPVPQPTVSGEAAAPTPVPTEAAKAPELQAVQLVVAVTDLAVGPGNRVAFALISQDGPVKVPTAAVQLVFLGDGGSGVANQFTAIFRPWPVGPGGVYAAVVDFEEAGTYGMEARIFLPGGVIGVGKLEIAVATASSAPALGERPPASRNKTSVDLDDPTDPEELATITSSEVPDPDLYRMTVAQALDSGLVSVISFATPAFCQSATCGPQVEVISAVKASVATGEDAVNFIHIEVYDSPDTVTDLSRARLAPQMEEWGLLSEPFTFILDAEGKVAVKFEGFVNEVELAEALQEILN